MFISKRTKLSENNFISLKYTQCKVFLKEKKLQLSICGGENRTEIKCGQ